MRVPFKLRAISVLSLAIFQLSGCGEGGSNLANPVVDKATTITSCQGEVVCVSGQFVDEPVVGLNYSCNLVSGVTDGDGTFTCPNNSVVTFFLKASSSERKITLGQYRIKSLGSNTSGAAVQSLIQMTPRDLTKVSPYYPEQDLDSADAIKVTNMLRLLQALDSDGYSETNPALNRIVIKDTDKQNIDILLKDVEPLAFASKASFDALMQPVFDKMNKANALTSITDKQAQDRFKVGLKQLNVGVYEISPLIFPIAENASTVSYSAMLARGTVNNYSLVGLSFLIDRENKAIGTGLEWQATLSDADITNGLFFQKLVTDNTKIANTVFFDSESAGFDLSGKVSSFKLNVTGTGVERDVNENGQLLRKTFFDSMRLDTGLLSKGVILPTQGFYKLAFGTTENTEDSNLGTWSRRDSNNQNVKTGTYTLTKSRVVTSLLEPSIWKTAENINVSEKPVFPLHLRLTFRDSSEDTTCSATKEGCLIGTVGISILENGNIITDMDNDCSSIDKTTLKDLAYDPLKPIDSSNFVDNTSVQEHRLGLVSTVLRDEDTQAIREAIAPIILVGAWAENSADSVWRKLFGVQLGVAPKIELDVANAINGIVVLKNQKNEQSAHGVTAKWTNFIKAYRLYSKSEQANIKAADSAGKVTSIQTQACYNPQPKQ